MIQFHIDSNQKTVPFSHFWELCVGSCHAYTALRADYQAQLKKAKDDCGFQYVRFHGLLNDDMCVVTKHQWTGELRYNFFNIDTVFDFLLSIGMKPFVEIGFMPTPFASGETTCFHYKGNITPPADYDQWSQFIVTMVHHLIDRYGLAEVRSWFFEVWNEPNLPFFFDGTQADYFKLYEVTVRAIKSVDAQIPVGGPATSINAWIPDMIDFCERNEVPLDFVSTHHYPSDDPLWRDASFGMDEFMKMVQENGRSVYKRGVLQEMTTKAKQQAGKYPLYYTEWNTSAMSPEEIHDQAYSGALVAKSILDNHDLVEAYSFWTFTDIFEEGGQHTGEFHGGFGLQTVHGIPKPTYRVMQLLHQLGQMRYPIQPEQETVGIMVTEAETATVAMLYNHQVQGEPIEAQLVTLTLEGKDYKRAEILCVDEKMSNAYTAYQQMGSPVYASAQQVRQLQHASELVIDMVQIKDHQLQISLTPHAVAVISLYEE